MNDGFTLTRKQIVVILVVVFLAIIGLIFWNATNVAKLKVTSEDGSLVYVAEEVDGEFIKLGENGKGSYSTKEPGPVFVRAVKDGKVTIKTVELELRKTAEVNLSLRELSSSTQVANEALANFFIANRFAYGVNPSTGSLDYSTRTEDDKTSFFFFGFDKVTKVDWVNKDLFVARSSTGNAAFVDGVATSLLGAKRTGNSAIAFDVLDFTLLDDRSIALATRDSLVFKDSIETRDTTKVGTFEPGIAPILLSDESFVYLLNTQVEYGEDEGVVPDVTSVNMKVFNYEGTEVYNFDVEMNEFPLAVANATEDSFIISAENSIVLINKETGEPRSTSSYFSSAIDLVKTDTGVVMLNRDGLWRYDTNSLVFELISPFSEGSRYVPSSLSVSDNGRSVFYSSDRVPGSFGTDSASSEGIFRVDL